MDRRQFIAGGFGAVLAGTAGCAEVTGLGSSGGEPLDVTGDWPRVEFDQGGTGSNSAATGPSEQPEIQWETDHPVAPGYMPAILVADDTVFFSGGSVVSALDIADGSEQWQTQLIDGRTPMGGRAEHCSATSDGEQLYLGTQRGLVVLTTDGKEAWSHEVPEDRGRSGVFRSPVVSDDTVYFCTAAESALLAYSTDGDEKWRREFDNPVVAAPAVTDDRVFVTENDGGLHAFSRDGEHEWTNEIGSAGHAVSPTVAAGMVFTTGHGPDGHAFVGAFSPGTGDEIWINNLAPTVEGSMAVLWKTRELAVPAGFGQVFMYDLETGGLNWGTQSNAGNVPNPAADGDSVYIAGGDRLTRFAPRGGETWHVSLDGASGGVAVVDDAIFAGASVGGLGSSDGKCYALAQK